MPCKTAVFIDDEIYLDSFQYRQASGRAGRRGFDSVGNVVFLGVPLRKVERLVSSYIPQLRPHFPIGITFSMQLFDCAFKSSPKFETSVNCILQQSFWNHCYPSKISQAHYDAVFSLNFLMDMRLINENGKFSLFSPILERLHYHEPSNFILYNLIVSGVLHQIVETSKPQMAEETIMNIFSHLFNPYPSKGDGKILPPMPDFVISKIDQYNNFVIESYTNFFVNLSKLLKEKSKANLNLLPLSKLSFKKDKVDKKMSKWCYSASLASPFAALSGLEDCDLLKGKHDLYLNVFDLIHIDSKLLPFYNQRDDLNSYALRFYLIDNFVDLLDILEEDEGIQIGDLMNQLKDFNVIFYVVKNCLNAIAPDDDPLKCILERMSDKFTEKYQDLIGHICSTGY